ncbi:TPA: hypothetical protein ACTZ3T_001622 [Bacillus cereus]
MPNYTSVESGHLKSKIVRFIVDIGGGTEALHVYEVQFAVYPGLNNDVIYSGGYRRINVAEQGAIGLYQLEAKNDDDALTEVTEDIKRDHSYSGA